MEIVQWSTSPLLPRTSSITLSFPSPPNPQAGRCSRRGNLSASRFQMMLSVSEGETTDITTSRGLGWSILASMMTSATNPGTPATSLSISTPTESSSGIGVATLFVNEP